MVEKVFNILHRIKIESIFNSSKEYTFVSITFVNIKCQNLGDIMFGRHTYIYVKIKQHTYSNLYLLKYIKEYVIILHFIIF